MNVHAMTPDQLRAWAAAGHSPEALGVRQLFVDYDLTRKRCQDLLDNYANWLKLEGDLAHARAAIAALEEEVASLNREAAERVRAPWEPREQ